MLSMIRSPWKSPQVTYFQSGPCQIPVRSHTARIGMEEETILPTSLPKRFLAFLFRSSENLEMEIG